MGTVSGHAPRYGVASPKDGQFRGKPPFYDLARHLQFLDKQCELHRRPRIIAYSFPIPAELREFVARGASARGLPWRS